MRVGGREDGNMRMNISMVDLDQVLSECRDELEIVRAYEIGLQLPPSKTSSNVTFSKAFDPNLFASPSRIGM
jgi:hypothetical protein